MALGSLVCLAALILTACSDDQPNSTGEPSGPTTSSTTPSAATSSSATAAPSASGPQTLPGGCFEGRQCLFDKGTYFLGDTQVVPGLRVTLPAGRTSTANEAAELELGASAIPEGRLLMWLDPAAVKSTGGDHATLLRGVDRTPRALTSWLAGNPDFRIISPLAEVKIGQRIEGFSLSLTVSPSARYGDSGCPANPRCANLITIPKYWHGDFFGIGGDEEVRLYLATVRVGGQRDHTLMIVLDAPGHHELVRLTRKAWPILHSLRPPA